MEVGGENLSLLFLLHISFDTLLYYTEEGETSLYTEEGETYLPMERESYLSGGLSFQKKMDMVYQT